MIRFCAVLRPVWNRVCKQQNRRIILVAVAFLVALPWIISSCNKTKTTKEAQSHITEAIVQVHQAETPVPTPDSPYKSEAEAVARVLYGIRNNKEQDLRTYSSVPPGTRHRGLFSCPPVPAAVFSARPSLGASPRPTDRS